MSLISTLKVIRKAAQVALVVVLMASLGAAGANSARRFEVESKRAVKEVVVPIVDLAQVGPGPADNTPGGNMTPGSRPTTEQLAVLSAVTVPTSNDRSQDQPDHESLPLSDIPTLTGSSCSGTSPLASLALVTPRSARLCTLVGAVPSGTM